MNTDETPTQITSLCPFCSRITSSGEPCEACNIKAEPAQPAAEPPWRSMQLGEITEPGDECSSMFGEWLQCAPGKIVGTEGWPGLAFRTRRPLPSAPPDSAAFIRALDGNYLPCDYPEDAVQENGNYSNLCPCGTEFIGHKRRVMCKVCATTPTEPEPAPAQTAPCPECKGLGGYPICGACNNHAPAQTAREQFMPRLRQYTPRLFLIAAEDTESLIDRADRAEAEIKQARDGWAEAEKALECWMEKNSRLMRDKVNALADYGQEKTRADRAEARVADLEWVVKKLNGRIDEAEAERDRLREALAPFASLNPQSRRVWPKWDKFVAKAREAINQTTNQ
jgi:hypothetical protein